MTEKGLLMLPARTLTFQFDRVLSADGVTPEEWEVTVVPLGSALDGTIPNATLVGNAVKKSVVLSEATNAVVFNVVPSDSPGLSTTQWYRTAWRPKFFGKMTVKDFTMPDADVTFNQLQDLGAIIGSDVYLRQADVGTHVAGLDSQGFVLDGHGARVGIDNTPAIALINQEKLDRQSADNNLLTLLQNQITDQVAQTLSTATVRINNAVSVLESADLTETGSRESAVAALNASLSATEASLNEDLAELAGTVSGHTSALATKADLVSGKIITSQLPSLSLTTAVAVSSQANMLALTTSQVQPGDLAVRPDGSWMLLADPPATLSNWIKISTGGNVISVNDQVGAIHLGAADVGAIAIGAMIDSSQITGLAAALGAKAATTVTDGLNTRLSTIENDATIVRTVSSLIAKALLPVDSVFVNGSNQLTHKDGTVISLGGGGAPVDWAVLFNVPTTFAPTIGATATTAVAGNDTRLTNARTPTAHAASHAAAGSDPITITKVQVTGLNTTLTDYGSRISDAETAITDLEAGGGGGGGGSSSAKSLWFDHGTAITGVTDLADFQTGLVLQKGPFGQSVADNTYYYDPTGADNDEWRWPMLTPNGHLRLIKWDETAPADDALATQASVDDLTTDLGLKADASTVTALSTTVTGKADKTYVDNADNTLLTALNSGLAGKAAQSDFTTLSTTVAGKAASGTVTTLAALVDTKADADDVSANTTDIADIQAALPNKADLVGGTVPNNQLRDDIPATKISGLNAAITGKADLVSGTVPLSQMSQVIPKSYIINLTSDLAGKADLVGGKLASSQIPALAINDTFVVANRAGMLALTTAQVQQGDVAVITATVDKGTYIYTGSDPSLFGSWTNMSVPSDAVGAVNGMTGSNVVLSASDVGARSASDPISMNDVTNLNSSLTTKADASATTAALATKVATSDVQALMSQAAPPQPVDLVATTNLALSGTPSVDGVLTTVGMRVLATAQASSVNNGVYVVSAGTWARATDMNGPTPSNPSIVGGFFLRGIVAIVGSAGSAANANTVWMQTATSGVIGTNANNWVKAITAGPPLVYTAATNSGLTITGTAVVVKNTTGISVTSAGVGVDHTKVPFTFTGDVPAGSTTATITHNLGTTKIASVALRDKTSNAVSLIGWTVASTNAITLEFATAPTSGQYEATVAG